MVEQDKKYMWWFDADDNTVTVMDKAHGIEVVVPNVSDCAIVKLQAKFNGIRKIEGIIADPRKHMVPDGFSWTINHIAGTLKVTHIKTGVSIRNIMESPSGYAKVRKQAHKMANLINRYLLSESPQYPIPEGWLVCDGSTIERMIDPARLQWQPPCVHLKYARCSAECVEQAKPRPVPRWTYLIHKKVSDSVKGTIRKMYIDGVIVPGGK